MNPLIQAQWRCMRDNKLSAVGVDRSFKQLWKANIPLKIKIWLWFIWHNAITTKDNIKKESGLVVSFASFALLMKASLIYSLLVPWLLTCGV
jgi:hypothetical protein